VRYAYVIYDRTLELYLCDRMPYHVAWTPHEHEAKLFATRNIAHDAARHDCVRSDWVVRRLKTKPAGSVRQ
jgi:hypothetical protein